MDDVKVIAFYLPQFYRTKENDEWWGEGFTDWTSAKNAKPLFEDHYQPHVPLNDYYYDLSEKETMQWQAELMNKYDVDGLCFYHYWFKDGKRVLERPAENLLKWTDIDMPFCFSWANQTWARSWSNIKEKNVWSTIHEMKGKEGSVLLEQDYGTEADWAEHFDYLISFFKDKRYIKVDNRPLILIHRSDLIYCLEPMIAYWRKKSLEIGFDGLCVLGGGYNEENSYLYGLDGILYGETTRKDKNLIASSDDVVRVSYDEVWGNILQKQSRIEHPYYVGIVGYDDTPRQGKKGTVVENIDPRLFEIYLSKLMAKNVASGSDIVFLNAWNEWGEGMHLEPDKKNEYAFLEKIKIAKNEFGKYVSFYNNRNSNSKMIENPRDKYELYLNDLDFWMTLRERGVEIVNWFYEKKAYKIAIYGYGIIGKHLCKELENSDVQVDYIIDQKKGQIDIDLPVYSIKENIPYVDVVVITAYYYYDEIKSKFNNDYKVVSFRDVIYSFEGSANKY